MLKRYYSRRRKRRTKKSEGERKIMKKAVGIMMIMGLLLMLPAQKALAYQTEEEMWIDFKGSTARGFTTDSSAKSCVSSNLLFSANATKTVEELYVNDNSIQLEETGRVEFVDLIALYTDGTYENVAAESLWSVENPNIISAFEGQVIAEQMGTTSITVTYQNMEEVIEVTVEETINVEDKIEQILGNTIMPLMSNSQRNSAATIAAGMVNLTWTPTSSFTTWTGSQFAANNAVTGLPYSQTPNQKDAAGFISSMSSADFYTQISSNNRSMPRYGNDCSGFVSFAYGISRTTTNGFLGGIKNNTYNTVGAAYYTIGTSGGRYVINNYDDVQMETSFLSLAKGDSLVQEGHMFLVAANNTASNTVYVYEQTPNKARYTSYSYSTLADGEFVPFCLK
jgi:hypothetical protein